MADSSSTVKIDVGAKAGAHFEVKTEVPTSVAGRFVSSVIDLFSPISERMGLRGDMIRLQREDVLICIAEKMQERLRIERGEDNKIPNKILIPNLEKASLEDKESLFVDWWANLFVQNVRNKKSQHPIFGDFISRITQEDGKFLKKLMKLSGHQVMFRDNFIDNYYYSCVNEPLKSIVTSEEFGRYSEKMDELRLSTANLFKMMNESVKKFGIYLTIARVNVLSMVQTFDNFGMIKSGVFESERNIENCIAIGVLRRDVLTAPIPSHFVGEFSMSLEYIEFTDLGREFMNYCLGGVAQNG